MELSELEIGIRLEMELFNDDGTRFEPALVSEMECCAGAHEAVIAAPILQGKVFPVQIGTAMNLYFLNKKDAAINLYKFSAVVKSREMSGNLLLLRVEQQSEIEKVQRRMFFRLDCSIQVQYRQVDSIKTEHNEDIAFKSTITDNISGGGLSMKLEEKIDTDSLLECEIFTSHNKKVRFFSRVIRCEKIDMEGKSKYKVAIKYVKITEKDREAIVRYIFNEQRRLRKKGLI
jgi:c-di-GMP-binding flagellar brake protein YcgR